MTQPKRPSTVILHLEGALSSSGVGQQRFGFAADKEPLCSVQTHDYWLVMPMCPYGGRKK